MRPQSSAERASMPTFSMNRSLTESICGRMSHFLVAEVTISIGEMTCGERDPAV